jgi:hypothetical protein
MDKKNAWPGNHDIANFTIRDMTECGKFLRESATGAESMEEVAGRIVRHLYDTMIDGLTGERACALVRFFKTHSYEHLDAELKGIALNMLRDNVASSDMKCLTLLATLGEKPAWNSRRTSNDHKVIPLPSEDAFKKIPMMRSLIKQLGLSVSQVIKPDSKFLHDKDPKTYNVFLVADAFDSPYIPAQKKFVIPCGVKSVLGFGGVLPEGEIFMIVMFSKVRISIETADLFKTLSLNIKIAILPFEKAVFAQHDKTAAA